MIGLVMTGALCRLCKAGRLSFDERTRYFPLHCWRCERCGELFYDQTIHRPATAHGGVAFVRISNRNVRVHPMQEVAT